MIGIVYDDNGTKKIKPLAGSSGSGLPLGTILPLYTSSVPTGYLPCDGSTFDASEFPALYGLLGTNVLPDLREVTLVGAGQNTTNTIASHDVYTIGQFKDDQLQSHTHNQVCFTPNTNLGSCPSFQGGDGYKWTYPTKATTTNTGRSGDTTHGKQTGVNYVIKAVSGITEADKDYVAAAVANEIKDGETYSTTEIKTNKTWIDGKPIYRKVVDYGTLPNSSSVTIAHNISNISFVTNATAIIYDPNGTQTFRTLSWSSPSNLSYAIAFEISTTGVIITTGSDRTAYKAYVTIEYTKTTD